MGFVFTNFPAALDKALDLPAVEKAIRDNSVTHLAVVHHETSTGLLNDIMALGALCRQYAVEMIVDAVSSFAAVEIEMHSTNISYLAASSAKNIQGLPGVSFVVARISSLIKSAKLPPKTYYLNLYAQYAFFSRTGQMRFTPPVQTLYALQQALSELKREGINRRYQRYSESWETLTKGITRLGLSYMVDKKDHSRLITAIYEPLCKRYDFQEMHDYLYNRGFTIYPGKLNSRNTFRVANIGDITSKDIRSFLQVLEMYLREIGYPKLPEVKNGIKQGERYEKDHKA